VKDKKFKHLQIRHCYADHDEIFTSDSHHECYFKGKIVVSLLSKLAD